LDQTEEFDELKTIFGIEEDENEITFKNTTIFDTENEKGKEQIEGIEKQPKRKSREIELSPTKKIPNPKRRSVSISPTRLKNAQQKLEKRLHDQQQQELTDQLLAIPLDKDSDSTETTSETREKRRILSEKELKQAHTFELVGLRVRKPKRIPKTR
jgi:hypothetical protein